MQVPFGVVGNVARCYPICSIYKNAADRSAPNHPEIDGTASIFAHEVVEAVSNPGTGGWCAPGALLLWLLLCMRAALLAPACCKPRGGRPLLAPPLRYDPNGLENADKCAWTFGNSTVVKRGTRKDGSTYNFNSLFGGREFMVRSLDPCCCCSCCCCCSVGCLGAAGRRRVD